MEAPGDGQPGGGKILAQGGTEARRPAEPDAGLLPRRNRLTYPVTRQAAITRIPQHMQTHAGSLGSAL